MWCFVIKTFLLKCKSNQLTRLYKGFLKFQKTLALFDDKFILFIGLNFNYLLITIFLPTVALSELMRNIYIPFEYPDKSIDTSPVFTLSVVN